MGKRIDDIRSRMKGIESDLTALEALDAPTDEDSLRMDALLEEFKELETEEKPLATRMEDIAKIRKRMANERNREGSEGDDDDDDDEDDDEDDDDKEPETDPGTSRRSRRFRSPDLHVKRKQDPFRNMDAVRQGLVPIAQVRSRAMQVVESFTKRSDHWALDDDAAANCEQMVMKKGAKFGGAIARQMLITGGNEYLAAFENYLSDPGGFSTRAALSLTPANGGYLVPFTLDPTIILTNAGSANPYRQIATVKTTATNNWNGVTSAGVNAEWTAEGIEAADLTPTLGNLQITPQKADAYLFGSFEVLSDSDFAAELPGLLADAKDRLEEAAFALGTGTGQPWGSMTRATSQTRAGTATGSFTAQDALDLQAAIPARWRGPRARNAWVGNLTTMNRFRVAPQFTGATIPVVDDSTDPPRMLGKPFYESTTVLGTFTTGNKVLIYGDWSQYFIVDRVGMSIVYDPVVLGANRRPTGQGAWYAFWRVGADVSTTTAFKAFATAT